MTALDFVIQLCGQALSAPSTYLRAGRNGPYGDTETPVRNYGHWLITFSYCYRCTGDTRYKDKAASLAGYLCSPEARPGGYSFFHRTGEQKDKCNGLIGQAWSIEALAEAALLFDCGEFTTVAEDVFFAHPFVKKHGLWRRCEVDGRILGLDLAFNHQLWFAACASLLRGKRRDGVRGRVAGFMDHLDANLTVFPEGLIYHPIEHLCRRRRPGLKSMRRAIKALVDRVASVPSAKNSEQHALSKSIGYHAFNTYAFGMLRQKLPDHAFWGSETLSRLRAYLSSEQFRNALEDNVYGYPYNPPGFEVAYSLWALSENEGGAPVQDMEFWVNEQIRRSFSRDARRLELNTEDPETLTSRAYELTRIPSKVLERIHVQMPV